MKFQFCLTEHILRVTLSVTFADGENDSRLFDTAQYFEPVSFGSLPKDQGLDCSRQCFAIVLLLAWQMTLIIPALLWVPPDPKVTLPVIKRGG